MPPPVVRFVYFPQRSYQLLLHTTREQTFGHSHGFPAAQPNQIFKYVRDRRQLSAPRVNTKNCAASTSLLSSLHCVCVACLYRAFIACRYTVRHRRGYCCWVTTTDLARAAEFTAAQSSSEKNGWHFKGVLNGEFWSEIDKMSPSFRSLWTENSEEKMFAWLVYYLNTFQSFHQFH
jgi:hypothetical protein